MAMFLVTCFTSIIYSLLLRICLAINRCPPYSINFAAYGLPECQPSYTVTSKHEFEMMMKKLKCIGFGKWQVPPAKGCSSPADLPIEMRVDYPCQCHLGGKCRLRCADHYELVGKQFMECSPLTSTYSIEATCVEVTCGDPHLPEHVQPVEGKCDLAGDCELRCVSDDFVMQGGNVIRCHEKAWSEPPRCNLFCKFVDIRSDLRRKGNCSGELEEMCPVECLDPALTLNGPINIACQATGKWSEMPNCGCNANALPKGVVLTGACAMAAGTRCAAGCDSNHEKDGRSVYAVQCGVDGKWQTARSIKCMRVCGPPALHSNVVLRGPCDRTVEGGGCPVGCSESYMHLVGSAEVICLATGLFSAVPHCALPDKCPGDLFHGMDVGGCDFSVGKTCTVACRDDLHKLVGNATMTCEVSGHWDYVPKCKRICVVPSPDASRSIVTCGYLEGETCTFKCADNYSPPEPIVITCLDNGQWSSVPKCVRMCPELVDLPSRMVQAAECSRLADTRCELACREHHFLILPGSNIRCQPSGQWTDLPQCKKKCSAFHHEELELAESSEECVFVEGNRCALKCKNPDKMIVGSGFVECTASGSSVGDTGCSFPCGSPPLTDGVRISEGCDTGGPSARCNLLCTDPLANYPSGTAVCDIGEWTININCEVKCGPIQLRPGAHAAGAQECSRLEGTECRIKCNRPNFFMDGKSEVTISCRNKRWTVPPLCEIQCDALAAPAKLRVKQPCGLKNGSACQLQCTDAGATMEGDPTFICQAPVWKGVVPSCFVFCLPPSGVSFQFDGTCSMKENVACNVKCSQGVRVGPDKVTCLETRSWSQFPECRTECPDVPAGVRPLTQCYKQPDSFCLLGCSSGAEYFAADGFSTTLVPTHLDMRCMSNMTWEFPDVRCVEGQRCEYSNGDRLKTYAPCYNGMYCRLYCVYPYHITKRIGLRCQGGKLDLSPLPQDPLSLCEMTFLEDCVNLTAQIAGRGLAFVDSSLSTLKFGEFAKVKCTQLYYDIPGKEKRVQCQVNGRLGTIPMCYFICVSLQDSDSLKPLNAFCAYSGTDFCTVECKKGYVVNSVMAECGKTGDWLHIPKCSTADGNCLSPWMVLPSNDSLNLDQCQLSDIYEEGESCVINTARSECKAKGISSVKTYCLTTGEWSKPVCNTRAP